MLFGPSVPDLSRIDPNGWHAVLTALPSRQRMSAALHPGLGTAGLKTSYDLAIALPEVASEVARSALLEGPRLPMPTAKPSRAGHQVYVRIATDNYESLQVAARLLGVTPTQIARMLINNGVHRVLAEHDAAIDRARSPDLTP